MDHLRHQKLKKKQLKNNPLELRNDFKSINISINDMVSNDKYINDTFLKKITNKEEKKVHLQKALGTIGTIG